MGYATQAYQENWTTTFYELFEHNAELLAPDNSKVMLKQWEIGLQSYLFLIQWKQETVNLLNVESIGI